MNFQVLPVNTPTFSVDLREGYVSKCIGFVVEWDGEEYQTRPISSDGYVSGRVGDECQLVSSLKEGSMLFETAAAQYMECWDEDIRERCGRVGCPIIK